MKVEGGRIANVQRGSAGQVTGEVFMSRCRARKYYALVFSFFLLPASAFPLPPSPFRLLIAEPVNGEPFAGAISDIDADWRITFGGVVPPRMLPAADLVQWGSPAEAVRSPVLVLADGGLLVADGIRSDAVSLTADSDLLGSINLPLGQMAGVVLHLPNDRAGRDRLLDRVTAASGRTDRLLLLNGDQLTGTINAIRDDQVLVQADVGPLSVPTDRIAAVAFRAPAAPAASPQTRTVWAGFADGSRLRAARLVVDRPAKTLHVTLPSGPTFAAAANDLVWLQPLGGRAVYLSDRHADGYRHVPFLSLRWPYRMDRSVEGRWLRSGGRLYAKGLGVHSAARLTYLLDGSYRRFAADLGVDDETCGGGSVRFRVFVDGQPKFTSEIVRGGGLPLPISVDITGAKRLDLVVDFADRADELDHADWLNARIISGK